MQEPGLSSIASRGKKPVYPITPGRGCRSPPAPEEPSFPWAFPRCPVLSGTGSAVSAASFSSACPKEFSHVALGSTEREIRHL